jgi:hypothetical protein
MNLRKHENIFSGILLLSLMAIMIPKELQGIELNQYLWKNRIILTLAEDEHPDLIKLKAEMKENDCEILNRDLQHFHFSNDGKIGNHTTTNDQSFRILLIGKDGGIKYESNRSVSLIHLFELIDSMPMRQDEMQHDRC